ncbi:MAG TPA: LCP family protein, partial [Candidatus Caenarcaniphilales bacterium]
GWQTLNGDQAEQFARFRNDQYGDIGRAQRQQALMKALRQRLINPLVLTRLPKIFSVMQKYIDTNLTMGELVSIVQLALQIEPGELKMVLLPGRFSGPDEYAASYWIMDPVGMERVMHNYFETTSAYEVPTLEAEPSLPELKIAIQNASSQPQASRLMARYLEKQGIHNVYIDQDWPDKQRQTQVIVQRGDLEAARSLQTSLGSAQVEANSTGNLDSDLTIRVGEDWAQAHASTAQP